MLPAILSSALQAKQGDTFSLTITLTDDSGTEIDLSGHTLDMQWRKTPTAEPVLELSTTNSRISVAGGVMTLSVSAADMQKIPVAEYLFDLQSTLGSTVETLLSGKIKIIADVTYASTT